MRAEANESDPRRVDLILQVRDTGAGIAERDLGAVFNPFEQRGHASGEGTGLGLAICKRLSEMMGGDIEVESSPMVGSCFTIRLPAIKQVPLEQSRANRLKFLPQRVFDRARLLIVDDDHTNREVLKGYLEFFELLELHEAGDGVEGVEAAKRVKPDLILMDMKMPRMSGLEATRAIRSNPELSTTPVVAVTARVLEADRKEILAACDGYLPKPLEANSLFFELGEFLPHYDLTELCRAVEREEFGQLEPEQRIRLKSDLQEHIVPHLRAELSHAEARRLLSRLAVFAGREREEHTLRWFAELTAAMENLDLSRFQSGLQRADQVLAQLDPST